MGNVISRDTLDVDNCVVVVRCWQVCILPDVITHVDHRPVDLETGPRNDQI
jgi:hypothetical protein